MSIADGVGDLLCHLHVAAHARAFVQREKRRVQVEPDIEPAGEGIPSLWHTPERGQRLLQPVNRGTVRRSLSGARPLARWR